MKKLTIIAIVSSVLFWQNSAKAKDYPCSPAALTNVTVTGGFWLPRFETNRVVTLIPYCAWDNRQPGNEMQTWFPIETASSSVRALLPENADGAGK